MAVLFFYCHYMYKDMNGDLSFHYHVNPKYLPCHKTATLFVCAICATLYYNMPRPCSRLLFIRRF